MTGPAASAAAAQELAALRDRRDALTAQLAEVDASIGRGIDRAACVARSARDGRAEA